MQTANRLANITEVSLLHMTTYVKAISVDELPNRTVKTVQIRGKKIAVIRLDDRFRAVDALCTHMGMPLDKGEICGDELVCPYHKARFCTSTGSKTTGPGACDLGAYEVRVSEGMVEVAVDWQEAEPVFVPHRARPTTIAARQSAA